MDVGENQATHRNKPPRRRAFIHGIPLPNHRLQHPGKETRIPQRAELVPQLPAKYTAPTGSSISLALWGRDVVPPIPTNEAHARTKPRWLHPLNPPCPSSLPSFLSFLPSKKKRFLNKGESKPFLGSISRAFERLAFAGIMQIDVEDAAKAFPCVPLAKRNGYNLMSKYVVGQQCLT